MSENTMDECRKLGFHRCQVNALTAHILDEVRSWDNKPSANTKCLTCGREFPSLQAYWDHRNTNGACPYEPPAYTNAPPAVERMSEEKWKVLSDGLREEYCNHKYHSRDGCYACDTVAEASRAREAEAGWKEAHRRSCEDVTCHLGRIDYLVSRIAELEAQLNGCGVHIERISREGIVDADKAANRIAELERDLATARGLLNSWSTGYRFGADLMQTATDTRAFLGAKESE